jgi:hypothetical protein
MANTKFQFCRNFGHGKHNSAACVSLLRNTHVRAVQWLSGEKLKFMIHHLFAKMSLEFAFRKYGMLFHSEISLGLMGCLNLLDTG